MDERVQIYTQITGFTPSIFQQDLIADRIKDVDRWRKAIIFWAGNNYRPQSVLRVIEYYEENPNGKAKHLDVGRSEYIAPPIKCKACNDLKEVTVDDPAAGYSGAVKFIPCADCREQSK